jgi:hypothetical protein
MNILFPDIKKICTVEIAVTTVGVTKYTYVGYINPHPSNPNLNCAIMRIEENTTTKAVNTMWAEGTWEVNKVWADRLLYTYSHLKHYNYARRGGNIR